MVIQKPDKGNTFVIPNKNNNILKLKEILDDTGYDWHESCGGTNYCVLGNLNNQKEISEKYCDILCPSDSKPGILYGITKTHKALEDGIPIFLPILSFQF